MKVSNSQQTEDFKSITRTVFRDKVLGCWLGKNAGGTLGGPFEEPYGREQMYDIDWYTELPEGGIPNDDLELQLIWLQALQDCGPGLSARDLAEYWLDCIVYNFDEYGLSKENLQKGLEPPLSGWHNNWFKDCMGSPIRSEIWACVAPGAPNVAAHYAYQDAICDHAGGESVYGEIFNAVFESCSFLESDKARLIELGLQSIPEHSLTYKAIRETVELFQGGVDWREARERIKQSFYSPIAQYSPINLGFQTIGLLYGADFGDAICRAVNCGWDTDCTAATAGAMIGIIEGAARLPEKWMAPLGRTISTNVSTGGLRNLRAPTDIDELSEQVCAMAERVLAYWGADVRIVDDPRASEPDDSPTFEIVRVQSQEPNRRDWKRHSVDISLIYPDGVAICADRATRVRALVHNPHPDSVECTISISMPSGWNVAFERPSDVVGMRIHGGETQTINLSISAPAEAILDANRAIMSIQVAGRPALDPVPISLVGGFRWFVSQCFNGLTLSSELDIDEMEWTETWRPGNALDVEPLFADTPGLIYLRHAVHNPVECDVVIGVTNTGRMKLYLNGEQLHETQSPTQVRPSQGAAGGDGSNYTTCTLKEGWNEILIQLERGKAAMDAHFVLAGMDSAYPINVGHALLGLNRSATPEAVGR